MSKYLNFICPTDGIKAAINRAFEHTNYFYTSLGNSVTFNADTMSRVESLLVKHNIQDINFILSVSNPIIQDALGNRHFSEIRGLHHFYLEISKQKQYSEVLYRQHNREVVILSYYLNKKIRELVKALKGRKIEKVHIKGKIYNKRKNLFQEIYPDLVCTEYFSRN